MDEKEVSTLLEKAIKISTPLITKAYQAWFGKDVRPSEISKEKAVEHTVSLAQTIAMMLDDDNQDVQTISFAIDPNELEANTQKDFEEQKIEERQKDDQHIGQD